VGYGQDLNAGLTSGEEADRQAVAAAVGAGLLLVSVTLGALCLRRRAAIVRADGAVAGAGATRTTSLAGRAVPEPVQPSWQDEISHLVDDPPTEVRAGRSER
jgi:hypothetical protein